MGRVDDASRGEPPRSCLVLVCVCGDAASRPPGLPILRSRAGVQAHTAYESLPHTVEAYEEALLDSAYYAAKGTSLDAAAAAATPPVVVRSHLRAIKCPSERAAISQPRPQALQSRSVEGRCAGLAAPQVCIVTGSNGAAGSGLLPASKQHSGPAWRLANDGGSRSRQHRSISRIRLSR